MSGITRSILFDLVEARTFDDVCDNAVRLYDAWRSGDISSEEFKNACVHFVEVISY